MKKYLVIRDNLGPLAFLEVIVQNIITDSVGKEYYIFKFNKSLYENIRDDDNKYHFNTKIINGTLKWSKYLGDSVYYDVIQLDKERTDKGHFLQEFEDDETALLWFRLN
jgi:hypothetical protein